MLNKIADSLQFSTDTLQLRARRQEVLTSNIANVDTPNYKAVDFDFKSALANLGNKAAGSPSMNSSFNSTTGQTGLMQTHAGHIGGGAVGGSGKMSTAAMLEFRRNVNPAMDNNTVDIEKERAAFAENAVKYEAAIRSINGKISTLKSAMGQGQ
ncbi:MAG: flagellar basal body rod protein FlgB [Limnobacter sp.]|nr:flagellar basal body rod protein FlgB [Limnobacter sp.]